MLILDEKAFCIETEDADVVEVLRSTSALNLDLPGVSVAPCEAFVIAIGKNGEYRVCSALHCKSRRTVHVFRLEAPVSGRSGYRAQIKDAKAFWEERGFHFEDVKINYAKAMREVVIRAVPVLMTPLMARRTLAERNRPQPKSAHKETVVSNQNLGIEAEEASAPLNNAARCEAEEVASQEDAEVAREQAEAAARKHAEEAARRHAEEAARRHAEEAARRHAEEAARKHAEEAARKHAEEAARKHAEEAARKYGEEAARKYAAEAARKYAEEAARKQAEEAARKRAEEAARKHAEEAARKYAEEAARKHAEEAARKHGEEAARKYAEEAARKQVEEEAARKHVEEAARKYGEEAARKYAEEAARKYAEEAARKPGGGTLGGSTGDDFWEKAATNARRHVAEELSQDGERGLAERESEDRRLKKAEAEALKIGEAAARKKAEELRALSPEQRAAVIMRRESEEARVRAIVDEAATLLVGAHAETDSAARRQPGAPVESFLWAPDLEAVFYRDHTEVAEIYSSLSMIVLSLEHYPQQHCSASICSLHRQGRVAIHVALRLRDSKRTLIYLPTRQPANMSEYRQIVAVAIRFLEVTGFLVEPTPLGATPEERRRTLATIPVLTLVGG